MKQKKGKSAERNSQSQDAIALLTEDHDAVKKLFKRYEKLVESEGDTEEKAELVKQICNELTIHAQIEDEIFYPAVREAIDDDLLMDEADVEHAEVKDLIMQLEGMSPDEDHYDAKVKVLGEQVEHHIKEEQGQMFPKVKKAKMDIDALGSELLLRKEELQDELDLEESDAASTMPPKTNQNSRPLHR